MRIDNIYTGSRPYDIELIDNFLYVALSFNGIMAFDISNPNDPVRNAYLNTGGELDKIHLDNGLIYGADGSAGILILNPWFSTSGQDIYSMPIDVKIYPNPASTQSIMEISGDWKYPLTIRVVTMDGRELGLKSLKNDTKLASIPMNQLMDKGAKQGIYFIVMTSGNKIKSLPFMWSHYE
jgi:hypothetical protein